MKTYFVNISGGDAAESGSRRAVLAFLIDAIAGSRGMRHDRAFTAAELLLRSAETQGRTCSINGRFAVLVA